MDVRILKRLGLVSLLFASLNMRGAEITVFAAASLSDVMATIGTNFQARTGIKVEFNFAASSTCARQIEEGAPADVFFSADEALMNRLAKEGLIDVATRKNILGNSLVVVIPRNSALQIESASDLTNAAIKLIALADPKVVPAGVYARAWLEKLQLWPAVKPKVVPTENVRAALAAVASGNVDAGIVYKTDASISKRVKIAYTVPRSEGPDISYPAALVKDSLHPTAAKEFLDCLSSKQAEQAFRQFGFRLHP